MKTAIELADVIDNSEETTGFERRCAAMLRTLSQEIERLTGCLEKANIQAEKFEREWYLRGDEIETLKADAERYRWYVAQLASGNLDKLDEAFRGMERVEVVTKQMFDAAIDAMKGAT